MVKNGTGKAMKTLDNGLENSSRFRNGTKSIMD